MPRLKEQNELVIHGTVQEEYPRMSVALLHAALQGCVFSKSLHHALGSASQTVCGQGPVFEHFQPIPDQAFKSNNSELLGK